jgi:HK97 family phage portal protein
VNSVSAMNVTAVIACVRVLAEGVSQVPLNVYRRREGGGSDIATDHPLHLILHRKPNYWQTSFEFRENLMIQVALTGNFYAFKNIVRGKIAEIVPMPPGSVEPKRSDSGVITYVYTSAGGDQKELPASAIWHVRGPSWDTWQGMDAVKQAREAIGLAMTTEDAHIRLHENGAQPSGLYSVEGSLDKEQYKALSDWVMSQISGANRLKPLILDRGAKWTPSAMSGVDAQHLDTRKFQIEEICRSFRVLPLMIGHADKTQTFASAEQMFLSHVVNTLMPWYERIEQSADVNLLTDSDMAGGIYVKFVPNGLMRGAAKDRAEYYMKRWQMGTLNANEIRELEDENPYLGGDIYRVQLNTTDASVPAPDEPAAPTP